MTAPAIRVLVVEDHPAVRQGLRLLLQLEGIEVCGEADAIAAAMEGAARLGPDLVLIDLALGDEDGLDLVRALAGKRPGPALLVYSMFEDAASLARALGAGAGAYVTKREPPGILAHAIRECAGGRPYLSPRIEQVRQKAAPARIRLEALSLQERQVYGLLGEGLAVAAIAARLGLSPRTVETYFARILVKLGYAGMEELRAQARVNPI